MADKVILKDVSKIYKTGETEYRALDHVDLNIEEGRFVVILGPSGAGKSTLLNLIGGMDNPTSGDVIVNGEKVTDIRQSYDPHAFDSEFIIQRGKKNFRKVVLR